MSGHELLENLISHSKGVVTSKDADAYGIHREYLREFVKLGKLERVSHGLYITPTMWEDKMLIYQLRREKLIYSHETALYLHNLTDRDPITYSVTVPAGYNTSKLNQDGLIVHTIKKELHTLGVSTATTIFGNNVRVYDKERTICDILRDRNHQDATTVSESLKKYVSQKDKDINKLMRYAGLMRIEKIVRLYMEVLL